MGLAALPVHGITRYAFDYVEDEDADCVLVSS